MLKSMKLIKEEFIEKQFTISVSESELGAILIGIGNMSNDEMKNIRNDQYTYLKKLPEDNYQMYKQIKIILGMSV